MDTPQQVKMSASQLARLWFRGPSLAKRHSSNDSLGLRVQDLRKKVNR